MDPLLAFAADFWWLGPAVIGAGAASFAGIRYQRRQRARTIEYAAARHELEAARVRVRTARAQVKSAHATLLVAKSARQSGQSGLADVDAARRRLADAQREVRAAQTGLRGRRVQVQAARAMLRGTPQGDEHLPLPRLMAAHDAVIARWMQYETDPAKTIAFPAMTDARVPETAALLTTMDRARWLRPASGQAVITPETFSHYRAAVAELEAAFEAAEAGAWRAAGAPRPARPGADTPRPFLSAEMRERWDEWARGAATIASSAAAAAADAAMDAVQRASRRPHAPSDEAPTAPPSSPSSAPKNAPLSSPKSAHSPGERPAPEQPRRAPWPVPRRSAD